ncbi:hypothetical protein PENANT_c014G09987 [Penicillium antarcticum]|uniref:DUF7702 domain-containing protein n=1 Tax=Penicillium antarcticum TaxID=416450 RepID=A0A1V6Q413_9EURO|nr:uncharacterized protein N7508_009570 [Penicillium antarcticum]KAJ5294749.1 hypothetical protein N7508_009570 [Penicillium antarcticum]OQD84008.1 hypothetical protein PENANT_c014G09987 [Penicillium antarcticum]
MALPLLVVRLLYSLISDFGNNTHFSLINGNIEELIILLMYTILGVITAKCTVGTAAKQGNYATGDVEYGIQQSNGRPIRHMFNLHMPSRHLRKHTVNSMPGDPCSLR